MLTANGKVLSTPYDRGMYSPKMDVIRLLIKTTSSGKKYIDEDDILEAVNIICRFQEKKTGLHTGQLEQVRWLQARGLIDSDEDAFTIINRLAPRANPLRLISARKAQEMSIKQAATKIGIAAVTLGVAETFFTQSNVYGEVLERAARTFEVAPDWLVEVNDEEARILEQVEIPANPIRLTEAREALGYTLTKIGEQMYGALGSGNFGKYESGEKDLVGGKLWDFSQIVNKPIDWLQGGVRRVKNYSQQEIPPILPETVTVVAGAGVLEQPDKQINEQKKESLKEEISFYKQAETAAEFLLDVSEKFRMLEEEIGKLKKENKELQSKVEKYEDLKRRLAAI